MTFADLGLSEKVLHAVEGAGYKNPTPIQEGAIPFVLQRRDVLGIAQTGTGKTASFTLPMLTLLEKGRARARMPRSLILEPTRELAAQVAEAFEIYGAEHKLTMALLIGGVSFGDQDRKIDRGADVLIATPGRLLDHVERGKLMLNGVETLVIDEADRMLDMGFIPDIERIFKLTPLTRQTLFFSATMPPEIQRLTNTFLHNPERIEVAKPSTAADTIVQQFTKAPKDPKEKRELLRNVIRDNEVDSAIIFCNRKRDVAVVYKSLKKHGFNTGELHGDMDQHARNETLSGFRDGNIKLLVASDVAARGLDIPDVGHVLNYDVPIHAEDYVHRIGRTGRAGKKGNSITLVTPADQRALKAIETLIDTKANWIGAAPAPQEAETEPRRAQNKRPSRNRKGPDKTAKNRNNKPDNQTGDINRAKNTDRSEQTKSKPASKSTQKNARPPRSKPNNAPVKGLGDHVPAFLVKPNRA